MQSPSVAKDTFFVLDLDRTLLNTGLVFDIFQSALNDLGYGNGTKLHNARMQVEASGGTFDVLGYIKSLLSSQQLQEVMDLFRNNAKEHELFNDGARELLAFLREHQARFGILTYGSERWQQEKLTASGLDDTPTVVIPSKGKGELIATWYSEATRTFTVPAKLGAGTYKHLVIIDDKASELSGLPPSATGLLYRPQDNVLPSQAGDIQSDNVHQVRSFKEAIDYITSSA